MSDYSWSIPQAQNHPNILFLWLNLKILVAETGRIRSLTLQFLSGTYALPSTTLDVYSRLLKLPNVRMVRIMGLPSLMPPTLDELRVPLESQVEVALPHFRSCELGEYAHVGRSLHNYLARVAPNHSLTAQFWPSAFRTGVTIHFRVQLGNGNDNSDLATPLSVAIETAFASSPALLNGFLDALPLDRVHALHLTHDPDGSGQVPADPSILFPLRRLIERLPSVKHFTIERWLPESFKLLIPQADLHSRDPIPLARLQTIDLKEIPMGFTPASATRESLYRLDILREVLRSWDLPRRFMKNVHFVDCDITDDEMQELGLNIMVMKDCFRAV
ncbi:hypothetical protein EIP91_008258 [Steccherinum ochraceum]|uniref:F-box domain-containing protein n=1 Tax=Steccherinum ochraceum TaxID=92696 RepID=A0A4V2MVF5_9APHY|nr:hypothetical protein EIP91_008258 [Steccherinum ochraceum]